MHFGRFKQNINFDDYLLIKYGFQSCVLIFADFYLQNIHFYNNL